MHLRARTLGLVFAFATTFSPLATSDDKPMPPAELKATADSIRENLKQVEAALKDIPQPTPAQLAVQKQVDAFEGRFLLKDIKEITRDNPNSLFRTMKRAFVGSTPRCSEYKYLQVKAKMGATELAIYSIPLMQLAGIYEDPFQAKYAARILTLLKRPKLAEQRAALSGYYQTLTQASLVAPDKAKKEAAEKLLIQAGVPEKRIRAFVEEKTALGPECLGQLNIPFLKQQKADIAKDRGMYLLEEVKKVVEKTGSKPDSLDNLPLQAGHPIFGESRDPYGNPYELKYEGKSVSILSLGRDGEKSDDDLKIGPITLAN